MSAVNGIKKYKPWLFVTVIGIAVFLAGNVFFDTTQPRNMPLQYFEKASPGNNKTYSTYVIVLNKQGEMELQKIKLEAGQETTSKSHLIVPESYKTPNKVSATGQKRLTLWGLE
ncbi:hypothetical protein [Carboxylicivirga sp. M1479]|uniref:hypothetical protein n=1 Tax=Carboxylicivirga sp. M1479 TaxID=2594476 RepID=UPI00117755C6|nr:hypothetical protein [Carboxylicivirga sp. M1479]TRX62997.1 hypothetical protein FNN09_19125 [Carboxylicivirga sp. M1479]